MKRYVKDKVGMEYQEWKQGDRILISTPTGSGKTTFVIDTLLRYAVQKDKHVVYFCNRKVLNDQIIAQSEKKIQELFQEDDDISAEEAMSYLHIFTYQNRERTAPHKGIKVYSTSEEGEEIRIQPEKILYYIFDEAHYFIADAVMNNRTNLWRKLFRPSAVSQDLKVSISIFLTATPDYLYPFLSREPLINDFGEVSLYKALHSGSSTSKESAESFDKKVQCFLEALPRKFPNMDITRRFAKDLRAGMKSCQSNHLADFYKILDRPTPEAVFEKCYHDKPDYSYIQPIYFKKYEELLGEIRDTGRQKWLIFVDDETDGLEFAETLEKHGLTDVGLLSRRRIDRDRKAREIYGDIVEDEEFSQRILITTSVMDCGINIHDSMVSNIVIACDNKTEFLQMLGRKRVDEGEEVRLFIKAYSYQSIRYRYRDSLKKLTDLNRFSLKNRKEGGEWKNFAVVSQTAFLTESEQDKLYETMHDTPQLVFHEEMTPAVIYRKGNRLSARSFTTDNVENILAGYSYSETAFLNILTQMRVYGEALDMYYIFSDGFRELCEFACFCVEEIKAPLASAYWNPLLWGDYGEVCRRLENYNGPQEMDHIFQINREHGKIDQRKRKESILCHEGNTHRNLRPRSFWRYSRESGSWEPLLRRTT